MKNKDVDVIMTLLETNEDKISTSQLSKKLNKYSMERDICPECLQFI